jgi:ABC-type multidrug transport system ATPase subunit
MEQHTTTPLIVADGVSKRYGKTQALDGTSFAAHSGEAVALWGPNGAGKTTLIKAILGLIAFEGTITVAGQDVRQRGKQARSLIGYVPQEAVFYDWPVQETMAFYARLKKADPARIPVLLHNLGLAEHSHKPVPALSGGLKQRLALAVALLSDPPLLLLDEPTANLDARARRDYLELLAGLRSAGKLIVFASHRFEELDALADRVIMLEQGRVAEVLSPSQLRQRLALELVLWIPEQQQAEALSLLAQQGFSAHRNGRGTLAVQVSHHDKIQPLEALSQGGIRVLDFELEQVTWN